MQYPLLAHVANVVYDGSVCNMHKSHTCTDEEIHAKLLKLGLPESALAMAENRLLVNPGLVKSYEESAESANVCVEVVITAWCKYLGLD